MRYQQRILTEPAANFRALARQGIQGRWRDALLKGALYYIVLNTPLQIILGLIGWYDPSRALPDVSAYPQDGTTSFYEAYLRSYTEMFSDVFGLVYLYQFLVVGALMLGVTTIYLRYRRRQEAPTELLFSGFSNYGRAFLLFLLMAVFIFLWSLLLVIPGLIAFYRYRLAFYILADNPNISPPEALRLSKELMAGNKWKLFCLDLSFIGWALLASCAMAFILTPFALLLLSGGENGMIAYAVIVSVATGVAAGMLYMYMGTATAAFYERAGGLLRYFDESLPS
jgi:uncharacterized membrane protein